MISPLDILLNNAHTRRDTEIRLSEITHLGSERIAIHSDYDPVLIAKIKRLPNRKYSRTLKLWHLPYNKASYQNIISSGITYTIDHDTIETRQTVPSSDNIDIESKADSKIQFSEKENDSGNPSTDISLDTKVSLLPRIIYNSGYLIMSPLQKVRIIRKWKILDEIFIF